jgi:hypothetical protein
MSTCTLIQALWLGCHQIGMVNVLRFGVKVLSRACATSRISYHKILQHVKLPEGLIVLWNDYVSSFQFPLEEEQSSPQHKH